MAVAHGLAHWSGVWEKKERMIETRRSGVKGMWMGIWEQTQNLKNTVSHVNAHQKAPNEETLKHQADGMTANRC